MQLSRVMDMPTPETSLGPLNNGTSVSYGFAADQLDELKALMNFEDAGSSSSAAVSSELDILDVMMTPSSHQQLSSEHLDVQNMPDLSSHDDGLVGLLNSLTADGFFSQQESAPALDSVAPSAGVQISNGGPSTAQAKSISDLSSGNDLQHMLSFASLPHPSVPAGTINGRNVRTPTVPTSYVATSQGHSAVRQPVAQLHPVISGNSLSQAVVRELSRRYVPVFYSICLERPCNVLSIH